MRSGGGKQKGSAFEREVCKRLSLWLSDGQRNDLLWRSAMSGGRATVQFNKGSVNLTQSGDISAVGQEAFEFCQNHYIECKHYSDLALDRSILCGQGSLANFWKVTVREAKKYKKKPVLIARQNRFPIFAIVSDNEMFCNQSVPIVVSYIMTASIFLFQDATQVIVKRSRGT